MPEINVHPPGTFNWIDLAAADAEEAKRFYAGLFGWIAHEIPVGPGIFTMLMLNGYPVASLYQLSEQHLAHGVPSHWMSYVAVSSVDETTVQAKALGGSVLVSPFEVTNLGRMALILDPTGAPFALWQANTHLGLGLIDEPGTLTWNALRTDDTTKAGRFYTALFDWRASGETNHTIFLNGDRRIAGMEMTDTGPHWLVHFAVADCNRAVKKVEMLGGKVLAPPADMSPMGRRAVVQDSQGGIFSVVQAGTSQVSSNSYDIQPGF